MLCGSGTFRTTVIFAAMEVVETITLKGGPHVPLPASLIHQDPDGTKWLKFRPSSHIIKAGAWTPKCFQEGQEPQFGSVSQGEGVAFEAQGSFASI